MAVNSRVQSLTHPLHSVFECRCQLAELISFCILRRRQADGDLQQLGGGRGSELPACGAREAAECVHGRARRRPAGAAPAAAHLRAQVLPAALGEARDAAPCRLCCAVLHYVFSCIAGQL